MLLDDAGRLAAETAQIIQLRAAHLALTDDFDLLEPRRMQRENTLDTFAVGQAPDREAPAGAFAAATAWGALRLRSRARA